MNKLNPTRFKMSDSTKRADAATIAQIKASPEYQAAATAMAAVVEGDACTTSAGRSGYMMGCGRGFVCVPS